MQLRRSLTPFFSLVYHVNRTQNCSPFLTYIHFIIFDSFSKLFRCVLFSCVVTTLNNKFLIRREVTFLLFFSGGRYKSVLMDHPALEVFLPFSSLCFFHPRVSHRTLAVKDKGVLPPFIVYLPLTIHHR